MALDVTFFKKSGDFAFSFPKDRKPILFRSDKKKPRPRDEENRTLGIFSDRPGIGREIQPK